MEPYPRCATCKHWEQYRNKQTFVWGWETDARDYGGCDAIPNNEERIQQNGDLDWSSIHAVTRNDFGCVLHEPKE